MRMSYEEWKEKYNPIVDEVTGWPWTLETFGPDLELVKLIPENYVWTLIDEGEEDEEGRAIGYILAGTHLVDRMLYVVTNRCWERKGLTADWQ